MIGRSLAGRARTVAAGLALLCVAPAEAATPRPAPVDPGPLAVLPFDNLAARDLDEVPLRDQLEQALIARRVTIVRRERLEEALARHRIRWTGGLADADGKALKTEVGARRALVTSVFAASEADLPRIVLHVRVVSLEQEPVAPVWATTLSAAGEDHYGLFTAAVVRDAGELRTRAIEHLADEIARHAGDTPVYPQKIRPPRAQRRFDPASLFIADDAPSFNALIRRVAVLPFLNHTDRDGAGEIAALVVTQQLLQAGIQVVEPGRTRQVILDTRLVPETGISLAQADVLRAILEVDMVITGGVSTYVEGTPTVPPRFEFSLYGIDTRARKVAWLARTFSEGKKGVVFFDVGQVRTTPALAEELVRAILAAVIKHKPRPLSAR